MKRIIYSFLAVFTALLITAEAGLSHGVNLAANIRASAASGETVTYTAENVPAGAQVNSIEIVATYTTGTPMSGARVQVFAPDDRATPWTVGSANAEGRFSFTPDLSKRGRWTVRVEEADHSNFIDIVI